MKEGPKIAVDSHGRVFSCTITFPTIEECQAFAASIHNEIKTNKGFKIEAVGAEIVVIDQIIKEKPQ